MTLRNHPVLHPAEAEILGLRPLTRPYKPAESAMCANVLRDMQRGRILAALVAAPGGVEVWREGLPLRSEEEEP